MTDKDSAGEIGKTYKGATLIHYVCSYGNSEMLKVCTQLAVIIIDIYVWLYTYVAIYICIITFAYSY